MVSCGGTVYLARSTDEAKTFPVVHTKSGPITLPLHPPTTLDLATSDLRIGGGDLFYLVNELSSKLYLRVSGDHGRHWSAPMPITPPTVTAVGKWAMAVRGNELSVSILGTRRGSTTFDGFLVATRSAAAALHHHAPVFYAAMLNTKKRPLLYASNVKGAGYIGGPGPLALPFPPPFDIQLFGNDFIGAAIAPNGTAWASFTRDCGPTRTSAGCRRKKDETRGFAGYLSRIPARFLGGTGTTPPTGGPSGHGTHSASGTEPATTGGTARDPLIAVGLIVAAGALWVSSGRRRSPRR
jgi:hypothetical protein